MAEEKELKNGEIEKEVPIEASVDPEAPKMISLPAQTDTKKFLFQFEEGASFNDLKTVLGAYRDHVACVQWQEEQKKNAEKPAEEVTIETEEITVEE